MGNTYLEIFNKPMRDCWFNFYEGNIALKTPEECRYCYPVDESQLNDDSFVFSVTLDAVEEILNPLFKIAGAELYLYDYSKNSVQQLKSVITEIDKILSLDNYYIKAIYNNSYIENKEDVATLHREFLEKVKAHIQSSIDKNLPLVSDCV